MPSLIDIRRRIRSVKNTQQITKAMKMVAAARLRRAQEKVISSRPFAQMTNELLQNIASAAAANEEAGVHPLLARREENRIQLVLVTADRGLAGAFNANLIKATQRFLAENPTKDIALELYGRKARDFFAKRYSKVSGEVSGISQAASIEEASKLSQKLAKKFAEDEVDSVYLIYNEFKSVLSQQVVVKKLLPVVIDTSVPARDYLLEQSPGQFLNGLLPRYIQLEVFKAFLESAAAEHAARMTAMESATSNANDVIAKLTLYMNQVRQASITREIIEVVSGAAALE